MKTKDSLTTYWQDSMNFLLGLGLFFSPCGMPMSLARSWE